MTRYGFALGTLMAEDDRIQIGAPGVWCIHSDDTAQTYKLMLDKIAKMMMPRIVESRERRDEMTGGLSTMSAAAVCRWRGGGRPCSKNGGERESWRRVA